MGHSRVSARFAAYGTRRQSMKGHWHEEEWLGRTSFDMRRCDKRGGCRRNNAAIFLCIVPWYRVIGRIWNGSFTAAVLRTHVDLPENSTGRAHYGTHLAILRNKISLYRIGITCVARYEAWGVIDATCEENQGMVEGGC